MDLIVGPEQDAYVSVEPNWDVGSIVLRQSNQRVDIPLAELDRIMEAMKALGRSLRQESTDGH